MVPQKILKVTSPLYYQEEWWFLLLSDIKRLELRVDMELGTLALGGV